MPSNQPPRTARVVSDLDVVRVECPCGLDVLLQSGFGTWMGPQVLAAHQRACDGTPESRAARRAAVAGEAKSRSAAAKEAYHRERLSA